MKEDAAKLVDRLIVLFGAPNVDRVEEYLEEYIRALERFDGQILRKAGDRIVRELKFWPRPAEIVELAMQYVPSHTSDDTPAHKAIRERSEKTRKLARDYMCSGRSSLIDMAMKQGWGRSLEDVIRDVARRCYDRDGQLPTMAMLERVRLTQDDVDYYRQGGLSHLEFDVAAIMDARHQHGVATTARNVAGDAA